MNKKELEDLGFHFKTESPKDTLSYEELQDRYLKLKKWLQKENIEIPIDIEPYTTKEKEIRDSIPQLYWSKRDFEDYERGIKNDNRNSSSCQSCCNENW